MRAVRMVLCVVIALPIVRGDLKQQTSDLAAQNFAKPDVVP
jgi:hypothetical protein